MKLKEKLAEDCVWSSDRTSHAPYIMYIAGFEKAREMIQLVLEDPRPQMRAFNLLGYIKQLGEEEVKE